MFSHRCEVEDISNCATALGGRLPHRAHRHPDAHLPADRVDGAAAHAAHEVEEPHPRTRAVDLDHGRKLRNVQRFHVPGDVADGECVDRTGVSQVHPFIHRLEVELAECAGWGDGTTALPAAHAVDLHLPQPVEAAADGDCGVPRVLQSRCPCGRDHLRTKLLLADGM